MKIKDTTIIIAATLASILAMGYLNQEPAKVYIPPEPTVTFIAVAEAKAVEKVPEKKIPVKNRITITGTSTRDIWLGKLVKCESGGRPEAINPKDRDNTPSYGLLQFKPTTFDMYKKRYNIEGFMMDPQAQIKIVRRMMDDPKVIWKNEFPDCVSKLGYPPK